MNNRSTSSAGRLVQDQEIAFDDKRAGDRNQRLLGTRKIGDACRGREIGVDQGQRTFRDLLACRPVDASALASIADGQRNILGNAHPLYEAQILVNEGDRLPLVHVTRNMFVGNAIHCDLAAVGSVDASQHLDKR